MMRFHQFAENTHQSCIFENSVIKNYILGVERKTRDLKVALNDRTL